MHRCVVGYALLALVVTSAAIYSAVQTVKRGSTGAGTPEQLTIRLQLDPGERVWDAAAGNLTGNLQETALVFGSTTSDGHPRIRVLHWQRDHYEPVWTFTSDQDRLVSLMARYTHDHAPSREDLITLWDSGSGHYLGAQIFEWNGRTYQEIWNLDQFVKAGQQPTQGAWFHIGLIEPDGDIGLVIRAPIINSWESRHDALPHQVNVYRWDARKQTFVLLKRFVDPAKSFE